MSHFMTPEQLADLLQVAPSTVKTWRQRRQGPPFVRLSSKEVRYDREAVMAWLRERSSQEASA